MRCLPRTEATEKLISTYRDLPLGFLSWLGPGTQRKLVIGLTPPFHPWLGAENDSSDNPPALSGSELGYLPWPPRLSVRERWIPNHWPEYVPHCMRTWGWVASGPSTPCSLSLLDLPRLRPAGHHSGALSNCGGESKRTHFTVDLVIWMGRTLALNLLLLNTLTKSMQDKHKESRYQHPPKK